MFKIPFLKFLFPLLYSILLSQFVLQQYWLIIGALFIVLITFFSRSVIPISIFIIGFLSNNLQTAKELPKSDKLYLGIKNLRRTTNSYKLECINKELSKGRQEVLIYLKPSLRSEKLKAGDNIVILNKLDSIKNNSTSSFDYQSYAKNKGYYYSAFLNDNEWKLIKATSKLSIREKIASYYKSLSPNASSLSNAILLGYKDDLDKTFITNMRDIGLAHILAISGLHLALIYGFIQLLFLPFKGQNIKVSKSIISLILIWGFAHIVDYPISVVRAGIMLSLIVSAELSNKKTNPINALFGAAFFILLFTPKSLFDVGFQYSFLAVLGIFLTQEKFIKITSYNSPIIQYFLGLFTISISAQILTFPLSIYYFESLSFSSLFCNTILVPFFTIFIYLNLSALFFMFSSKLSILFGKVIEVYFDFLNHITEYLATSLQTFNLHIKFDSQDLILCFFLTSMFLIWNKKNNGKILISSCIAISCFTTFDILVFLLEKRAFTLLSF